MPDFGGLQIEVRCVRCGRLPAANVTLYEMQNHLYICNYCSQEAEHRGKHITWAGSVQMQSLLLPLPTSLTGKRPLITNLPPDSVWARLELPIDTPFSKIKQTVREQMLLWSKKPDSAEKRTQMASLRECMEQIQDEEAYEEEREKLRRNTRKQGDELSVGGRLVKSALEFLQACEETQKGWADGERYLRTGELGQWILFQLEEREMAMQARHYKSWAEVSDFRALNEMLYCLVPERPFRLYTREAWQELDTLPSAEEPRELAMLCDVYWNIAVPQLYEGSMLYWLEYSRGIKGLRTYYENAVVCYAREWQDRSIGLELVLERAVPELEKPELVVDFDGKRSYYTLTDWDREIPHKAINVTITNLTRGFTSLDIALQGRLRTTEPDWIRLYSSPSLRGRPGAGMPGSAKLELKNLSQLKRGKTYQRKLYVRVRGENKHVMEYSFPMTLRPIRFYQGLRGKLWMWGLRGGIPGLFWNAAAGGLLAMILSWLIPALVSQSLFDRPEKVSTPWFLGSMSQAVIIGLLNVLRFGALIPVHRLAFPLVVAAIMGFVGFWTGIGKGHSDYKERKNAASFRIGAFWLSMLYVFYLLYPDGAYYSFGAAFQHSSFGSDYTTYLVTSAPFAGLLIFLLACFLASVHYRLEKYICYQYRKMLNTSGRR